MGKDWLGSLMLIFLQMEESSAPKYQILEAPCQCQDVSIA